MKDRTPGFLRAQGMLGNTQALAARPSRAMSAPAGRKSRYDSPFRARIASSNNGRPTHTANKAARAVSNRHDHSRWHKNEKLRSKM